MANASDIPEKQSITEFIKALRQHDKVSSVSLHAEEPVLDIKLESGVKIHVRVTNIYCVGEADVREILDDDPKLNVVVTLSAWNLVTSDAWEYGRDRKKGVFTWKSFFGALNYKKYWLYEDLPYGLDDSEIAAERRRRRTAWN